MCSRRSSLFAFCQASGNEMARNQIIYRSSSTTFANSPWAGSTSSVGSEEVAPPPITEQEFVAWFQERIEAAKRNRLMILMEDVADWISRALDLHHLTNDNLMDSLDTGVVLCCLAEVLKDPIAKKRPELSPDLPFKCWNNAPPRTFFARENVFNFITFCRSIKVRPTLIFESDDLVLHANASSVVNCLLEVGRVAAGCGCSAPALIELELKLERQEQRAEERRTRKKLAAEMKSKSPKTPPTAPPGAPEKTPSTPVTPEKTQPKKTQTQERTTEKMDVLRIQSDTILSVSLDRDVLRIQSDTILSVSLDRDVLRINTTPASIRGGADVPDSAMPPPSSTKVPRPHPRTKATPKSISSDRRTPSSSPVGRAVSGDGTPSSSPMKRAPSTTSIPIASSRINRTLPVPPSTPSYLQTPSTSSRRSLQSRIPVRVGSTLSIDSVGLTPPCSSIASDEGRSSCATTPSSSTSVSPHSLYGSAKGMGRSRRMTLADGGSRDPGFHGTPSYGRSYGRSGGRNLANHRGSGMKKAQSHVSGIDSVASRRHYGGGHSAFPDSHSLIRTLDSWHIQSSKGKMGNSGKKEGSSPESGVVDPQGMLSVASSESAFSDFLSSASSGEEDDDVMSTCSTLTTTKVDLDAKIAAITQKTMPEGYFDMVKLVKVDEGKYEIGGRIVLIRLLRNRHVMVRVGGGWDSLEHYLLRHASQLIADGVLPKDTSNGESVEDIRTVVEPVRTRHGCLSLTATPVKKTQQSLSLTTPPLTDGGLSPLPKLSLPTGQFQAEIFNLRPGWTRGVLSSPRRRRLCGSMMEISGGEPHSGSVVATPRGS
ncbi:unnamed protein product [Cyprideis torosa]|uniref:Uncharacterized protein n=1 Tax=Cyprideis torosa TaxID=163714 RepID=A0A7R8WKC9_9CRUS|nr:unnamed protein product [Cyprideis torosa]CAG0896781.1 unnamed protein product [Cyprideis torosa]